MKRFISTTILTLLLLTSYNFLDGSSVLAQDCTCTGTAPYCTVTDYCGSGYSEVCGTTDCGYCDCYPSGGAPGGGGSINWQTIEAEILSGDLVGASIGYVISKTFQYLFPLAGFILLAYLVIAGYQWMTSQGDPKGLEQARNNILYALIGFIVLFSAYWVVKIVATVLGIQQILTIFS